MALSNDTISQFAKLTNSNKTEQKETVAYGTIVISDGKKYVRLDGSNMDTPVSSTTSAKNGDRVMVTIKNHEAIVTGNITSPSPSQDDMDNLEQNVESKISEFDIIVADMITVDYLDANYLRAEEIRAEYMKAEDIEAEYVKTDDLEAEYIKADEIDAEYAKISTLESNYITAEQISAKYASVDNLEATNVEVRTIKADYVKTEQLTAVKGDIEELETKKLDTESAEILYANVDFTNINEAAVVKIFSESGIIKDLVVSEGTITGELVGVTIKGDLIEGNTVKADKLVVKGSDGLYYKLNFEGGTFKEGEAVPTDGLHGSVIVAETITAEKISVDDLVAFGATIGGFHISTNSLYSGVKSSATNTTRGVFLGDDGQFATGDSTNFIRYFKDQNGNYKLEIAASSIKMGGSDKNIIEEIEDVNDKIDNLEIGSRNYIQKTDIKTYHSEWIPYVSASSLSITDEEYLKITPNGKSNYCGAYPPKISKLEANTEYTLSFEAYADSDVELNYFYIMCSAGNKSLTAQIDITTTPSKYTLTFTTTKEYDGCSIMVAYRNTTAYAAIPFYLRRVCVVKGNVANDWTPAPEDVDNKIDDIQIGARNLLSGTKDMSGFYANKDTTTFGTYDNKFTHAYFPEVTTVDYRAISSTYSMLDPEDIYDKEVTLSFEARSDQADELTATTDTGIMVCFSLCGDTNTQRVKYRAEYLYDETFSTDWKRYSVTCTLTKDAFTSGDGSFDDATRFFVQIYDYSLYSMDVRKVKFEYGNKATDWSEAMEDVDNKLNTTVNNVNAINDRVTTAELLIDAINGKLVSLVIGEDGKTTLEQTGSGWSFDMTMFQDSLNTSIDTLNDLSGKVDGVEDLSTQLNTILSDVVNRTAYVDMKNEEINGVVYPYIELGKRNDPDGFKVKITTTALYFMEGSKPVAWVSNKTLYIEKAIVKQELHIGEGTGFIFAKRANGNMGIRWKESD